MIFSAPPPLSPLLTPCTRLPVLFLFSLLSCPPTAVTAFFFIPSGRPPAAPFSSTHYYCYLLFLFRLNFFFYFFFFYTYESTELSPIGGSSATDAGESEWEVRPGGMLVQKRNPDSDQNHRVPPPPTIRVRVKYGSIYHEINISSKATFGQLKKMLSGPTGLHHEDQKLLFKDKERDSKAFLDVAGVKEAALRGCDGVRRGEGCGGRAAGGNREEGSDGCWRTRKERKEEKRR